MVLAAEAIFKPPHDHTASYLVKIYGFLSSIFSASGTEWCVFVCSSESYSKLVIGVAQVWLLCNMVCQNTLDPTHHLFWSNQSDLLNGKHVFLNCSVNSYSTDLCM